MPIPLIAAPLRGNITAQTRTVPATMTANGPVRYVDGPLANLERPETANLVRNPRFAGMGTWAPSDPAGALFPDPAMNDEGHPAARVTVVSLASTRYILHDGTVGTVAPGEAYTISARARASQPGRRATMQLGWYTSAGAIIGSTVVGTQTVLATDGFTTISPLTAVAPDTASYARLLIRVETTNLQIGDLIWFSRPQLERGAVATAFTHGAMGAGYSWGGTPDASASRYTRQSKAYYAEEPTTNLFTNPSVENVLDFWGAATGGGTILTRETTHGYAGSCCVKVVTPGSTSSEGLFTQYNTNTTGTARPFTSSIHLKGAGTFDVWTRVNYSDSTLLESAKVRVTLGANWQRVIAPAVTTDPAKTLSNVLLMIRTVTAQVVTFWADAMQLEEKPYATSYCDGNMGIAHTWAGAAHASASSRTGASLATPGQVAADPRQGAMVMRFMRPTVQGAPQTHYLFVAGSWTGDDFIGLSLQNTDRLQAIFRAANTPAISWMHPDTLASDTWHTVILEWSPTHVYVTVNNGTRHAVGRVLAPVGSALMGGNISSNSTQAANAAIANVLTYPEPLSDAERARLATISPLREWEWGDLIPQFGGILRVGGEPRFGIVRTGG